MSDTVKQPDNPENDAKAAEPSKLGRAMPFLFVIAIFAFIIYKQLSIPDVGKVAIGLGLVIFIHELGHFLAAKLCGVRVETFSIGFGEPIPGCRFRYGETLYKIGWIPLGGYVKMLGEGDNVDSEDAEEDPRSFKNKSVGSRMIIISSGVVMNLLLALVCFLIAYSNGVKERAPIIGAVEAGSPAWRSNIHSDMRIRSIGNLTSPMFDDIKPIIMSTRKGEIVPFKLESPDGTLTEVNLEPIRSDEPPYPVIGVTPGNSLSLFKSHRASTKPVREMSAAANAQPAFEQGDQFIEIEDAAGKAIDLTSTPEELANYQNKFQTFYNQLQSQRGSELKVKVLRSNGEKVSITVPPQYTQTFGVRMQIGRISGIRNNSAAAEATPVQANKEAKGLKELTPGAADSGDKIVELKLPESDGSYTIITSNFDPKVAGIKALDPSRLPEDLDAWAIRNPKSDKLLMTVLRSVEHAPTQIQFELKWDRNAQYYRELMLNAKSPLSIPALGLCYTIEPIVEAVEPNSPADQAGIKAGDVIKEIKPKYENKEDKKLESWLPIAANQWGYFFEAMQSLPTHNFELKIQRGNAEPTIVAFTAVEDKTWPRVDRGFLFESELAINKAENIGEAFQKAGHRTLRMIRVIYQNLYAMLFGRISAMTMSGPLTIASFSYDIAGEDIWQFILFIGLINVNLAVVNFLPIPVLDGGHMVFLIYEKLRGKPANEKVLELTLYAGLILILSLMAFVLFLDVRRLFF